MARKIATFLSLIALCSGMQMRETVERTVMVRTTGSDLQPAATGYIYKKQSDGPASVVKMGESEVMEHLSKLYERPEAYTAPLPVSHGPFHAKEEDDKKAASHVIPVVEKQEEDKEGDHIDGIADDEYDGKAFGGYAADFSDYNKDFAEYLKSIGHFDDGNYHEHGGGSDYGSKGHKAHGEKEHKGFATKHRYGKGGAGDYHTEKYTSFSTSSKGGHGKKYDDADAFGKDYAKGHGYKAGDHAHKAGQSKGEAIDGFRKVYDKDEYKKDHDFYDGAANKGGFHKFADGHANHGSDAGGFKKGVSHESGHNKGDFGKGGYVEKQSGDEKGAAHSEEESGEHTHHADGKFGIKEGKFNGKSYGYEIKH